MTAEGQPETEQEIQAALRSVEWERLRAQYDYAWHKGSVAWREAVLAQIRAQFGERMAAGLAEWYAEE